MEYKNYIFDLYATLVDIRTDQEPLVLWRQAACLMTAMGASYEPVALRTRYRELIREEEAGLARRLYTNWPEADVAGIFERLLIEGAERGASGAKGGGAACLPGAIFDGGGSDLDGKCQHSSSSGIWGNPLTWDRPAISRWCSFFAYTFRVASRIRFGLYPDTLRTLERLQKEGKRIFLLSNAQSVFTRPEMAELGLTGWFEDVFISSEWGIRKPEPAFLRAMLNKHDLTPEETLMVGNDMASDIMMAAVCGVNGFLVNHDGYSDEEIWQGFAEARRRAPEERREVLRLESGFLKDIVPRCKSPRDGIFFWGEGNDIAEK